MQQDNILLQIVFQISYHHEKKRKKVEIII